MSKMCTQDAQKPISLSANEVLAFLLEKKIYERAVQCNTTRKQIKKRRYTYIRTIAILLAQN